MKKLTQDIFKGQPDTVDWAGVDYDGMLSFGKAINPRYTYGSERWRGFELVGEPIKVSGYEPLTSIKRDDETLIDGIAVKLFLHAKNSSLKDFKNFVKNRYRISIIDNQLTNPPA